MCSCTSCEYTDSFAKKGFDAWPRGEPAGSRRSAADYNAHVAHVWVDVQRSKIAFTPGQAPIFPSMPELFHAPARNTAFIAWNKGRKASPAETEPARTTQPGKAKPHFPAPDRERETARSIPQTYRVEYSANDSEECMAAKFMTVAQAAKEWDISEPRIRQWLQDGRIKGAQKIGRDWLIPAKADRPEPAKPGGLQRRQSVG